MEIYIDEEEDKIMKKENRGQYDSEVEPLVTHRTPTKSFLLNEKHIEKIEDHRNLLITPTLVLLDFVNLFEIECDTLVLLV